MIYGHPQFPGARHEESFETIRDPRPFFVDYAGCRSDVEKLIEAVDKDKVAESVDSAKMSAAVTAEGVDYEKAYNLDCSLTKPGPLQCWLLEMATFAAATWTTIDGYLTAAESALSLATPNFVDAQQNLQDADSLL